MILLRKEFVMKNVPLVLIDMQICSLTYVLICVTRQCMATLKIELALIFVLMDTMLSNLLEDVYKNVQMAILVTTTVTSGIVSIVLLFVLTTSAILT